MSATSRTSSSIGRDTSRPRVEGTMQYEQRQLQPTLICSQPWNGARAPGRQVPGEPLELEVPLGGERVAGQELGQAVDLPGAEGDVDEREAREHLLLDRLRPAAADAHDPFGVLALEPLGLAEMGDEAAVGRLADRARVEQDQVGLGALGRLACSRATRACPSSARSRARSSDTRRWSRGSAIVYRRCSSPTPLIVNHRSDARASTPAACASAWSSLFRAKRPAASRPSWHAFASVCARLRRAVYVPPDFFRYCQLAGPESEVRAAVTDHRTGQTDRHG